MNGVNPGGDAAAVGLFLINGEGDESGGNEQLDLLVHLVAADEKDVTLS